MLGYWRDPERTANKDLIIRGGMSGWSSSTRCG
jgi:hypothetical protein